MPPTYTKLEFLQKYEVFLRQYASFVVMLCACLNETIRHTEVTHPEMPMTHRIESRIQTVNALGLCPLY